jgi:hypothetical protein
MVVEVGVWKEHIVSMVLVLEELVAALMLRSLSI